MAAHRMVLSGLVAFFATTISVVPTTLVAATTSVEPTTSVAATTSVEPTTSVAATTSVEPITSVAATTSVEPITSVAVTASVKPTTSVATTTSVKPTTSVAATTSVKPTTSVATTTSVKPTTSVAARTSVKPSTSVMETTSVKPTTSVATTTSVKPTKSVAATTSVKPTTSVATTTSVKPTTSVAATTSVKPTTSVATTTSVKPTTSVATTTSVKPTSSMAATTPGKPTTSVAATTSVEPTTSVMLTTSVEPTSTVAATTSGKPTSSVMETTSVEPTTSVMLTTSVEPTTSVATTTLVKQTTSLATTTSVETTTPVSSLQLWTILSSASSIFKNSTSTLSSAKFHTSPTLSPTTTQTTPTATSPTSMAKKCWQITVTIHYTVGPTTLSVGQTEAEKIMGQVLSEAKSRLTCSGLTLVLISVTIATPSNNYAVTGQFGVIYGNMDASEKQTAFNCLGHQQIYSKVIIDPSQYTDPLGNSHWPDRASQSNPQDTTCVVGTPLMTTVVIATTSPIISSPSATLKVERNSSIPSTLVTSTMLPSASSIITSATSTLVSSTKVVSSPTPPPTAPPTDPAPTTPTLSVRKCYKLEITLLYNISQDLNVTLSGLNPSYALVQLNSNIYRYLITQNVTCRSIQVSEYTNQAISRFDKNYVSLSGTFQFDLLSASIPDKEVAPRLVACLNEFQSPKFLASLKELSFYLFTPSFTSYIQQDIRVHQPQSCCGNILPPCCPDNEIKKSKELCAPMIFRSYFNQTRRLTLGSRLLVPCAVYSLTSVTVSWRKNNNYIQTTGNALNQTLTIANIKTTDVGDYTCEVKNEYQVISKSFKLLVIVNEQVEMALSLKSMQFHPDLLNKASSRYINMSRLVSLQIENVLSNKMGKSLQIVILGFKQGSIVVDFKVLISETLTSPQDNPPDLQSQVISIMIEQINTGSFGNLLVGSLLLKVKPPPPSNLGISEKGTTFMTLSWKPPIGHQSYQIEKYIVKIRKQNSPAQWRETIVGSSFHFYKYTGLETNTGYEFQVTSRSPLGDGESSAVLRDITLTVKPIVANDGQNFTVTEGESIVLACQGSSDPGPQKVIWLRKAPPLADIHTNTTGDGKIVNTYMFIRKAKIDDSGTYGCRASYEDQSNDGAVHLIVNVLVAVNINVTLTKENFTEELKNKSSPKYKKLETRFVTTMEKIYENVTGFKEVIVLGFSNGSVKVRFRVVIVVKITKPKAAIKQNETKATATNLIIQQVTKTQGDLGNGLIIRKDSIETDAPPNPPRNVTVHDVKENAAHIRWSKPLYAEYFFVSHYVVKLKTHGDSEWQEKKQIASLQLDCPLENLQKDTAYNVIVFAKNNKGNGLDSIQQDFRTKDSSMLWLWILVSVAGGVFLWGGIMCCICIRKRKSDTRQDYDTTTNQQTKKQDVYLYSYNNEAFGLSLPDQDVQSLGLIPGKWWEIPRESLYLESTLGSGAFGLVKKAQLRVEDGLTTCAVKMNRETATAEDQKDLYEELRIMEGVGRHPNLVNLIGACTTSDGPLMIVLEFAENGSLIDYLRKNVTREGGDRVCSLIDDEKITIGLDIAQGMNHLANLKCVHRDLAARNVLLSENGQAKIADFGLSRDVYVSGFYEKTTQGKLPVRWMALEAIEQRIFTTQNDVWSYGVVLWEIETGGSQPYKGMALEEIVNYLKNGRRLHRPVLCKQDIYDVMLQCWDINPQRRPTFNELCLKMQTPTDREALLYN